MFAGKFVDANLNSNATQAPRFSTIRCRSQGVEEYCLYVYNHTHIYIHIDMYVHVQFHRVLGSEGCKQIEDHIIGNAVGCKVHLRGEAGDFSRVVEGTLSPPPTPVTTLRSMAQDETIRMSW